jgi:ABC-2 type transport system ATP-binding protein
LLLDEPTASLDVETAKEMRDLLLEERKKFKISILFTSHNMAEVEEICDRIVFIDHGKIIADDTPANLAKSIQTAHIEMVVEKGEPLEKYCKENNFSFSKKEHSYRVSVKEKEIANFLQDLSKNKIHYLEVSIDKPTLEDYFLDVVGGENK